jgi:hypothetical protein
LGDSFWGWYLAGSLERASERWKDQWENATIYSFEAKDYKDNLCTGELAADSGEEAANRLCEKNLTPVSVTFKRHGKDALSDRERAELVLESAMNDVRMLGFKIDDSHESGAGLFIYDKDGDK